jgi:hypothetical protein
LRSLLKTTLFAALFSAVAILLHSWQPPYGLFLGLIVLVVMMRYISRSMGSRRLTLLAGAIWFLIAWIASTERNGGEVLITADTIGSSFLIGASALVVLMTLTARRF